MFSSASSPQSTCDSPYTGVDDHPELVVVRLHILHLHSIIRRGGGAHYMSHAKLDHLF